LLETPAGVSGICAEDPGRPGGRLAITLEDLDDGRFAGPVGAEKGKNLPLFDLEADPLDRFNRAECLTKSINRHGYRHDASGYPP
jgi:hypothetical protein